MVFIKSFPQTSDKSAYAKWVEIKLDEHEEIEAEALCRKKNNEVMEECIIDAKEIVKKHRLMESQSNIIQIANSLFEKRASHEIFFKENKAREKFDSRYS